MTTSSDARIALAGSASPRCCRTPAEAFAAGMEDGRNFPPMTEKQAALVAVLLRPVFEARAAAQKAADAA